ncbi:isochorismatase family protein [Micromonospora eburnea]|uniref:Nicotinamidase-related amidase n=1 Tax=Micromonospora eburnea TaxID=227316 RepID=A0A1C6UJA0_9ACTN|nr:isochorismatase family protein [Micromonospora eburnea]SCL54072.1 Nicotinamidase-related amidase [Micromonospora eburnea]
MSLNLFTPDDTAILLIDHQIGTMSWGPLHRSRRDAGQRRRAGQGCQGPLVLTTSLEDHDQGPLAPEIATVAPDEYAARIQRTGVVNAMDDPAFAAAVAATGRRNLVIAGVTNDVCTVYPTLTALDQGYQVQVVADAGGSMSTRADEVALRRMENAGAGITSTNMILTELAKSWASPAGQALIPIVGELIPS